MSGVKGFSGKDRKDRKGSKGSKGRKGRKGSNEILKTKPVFDDGVFCRHKKSRYRSGFLK